jgi:chromosome segregation ATPase
MNARCVRSLFSAGLLLTAAARGAESFDDAMKQATLDYATRLRQANEELTRTREQIARERTPLLAAQRAAEDRIVAAESELTRLETAQEQFQDKRREVLRNADAWRKSLGYFSTLGHDGLKAFDDSLSAAERQLLVAPL